MAAACREALEMLLLALIWLWVKAALLGRSPLLGRDQWVRSVGCAALAEPSSEQNNNGLSLLFLPIPNYSTKAKPAAPASLPFSRYPSGQTPAQRCSAEDISRRIISLLFQTTDTYPSRTRMLLTSERLKNPLQGLAVAVRVNKLSRQAEK